MLINVNNIMVDNSRTLWYNYTILTERLLMIMNEVSIEHGNIVRLLQNVNEKSVDNVVELLYNSYII